VSGLLGNFDGSCLLIYFVTLNWFSFCLNLAWCWGGCSLMDSSIVLLQWMFQLVHLSWIVKWGFEGKWRWISGKSL